MFLFVLSLVVKLEQKNEMDSSIWLVAFVEWASAFIMFSFAFEGGMSVGLADDGFRSSSSWLSVSLGGLQSFPSSVPAAKQI